MEDFIRYILENIVEYPEDVNLQAEESEYGYVRINATVNPADMGKVIGKKGRTITAIRGLIKVKAIKSGRRVYFNLIDLKKDDAPDISEEKIAVTEDASDDKDIKDEIKVKSTESVEISADDFV